MKTLGKDKSGPILNKAKEYSKYAEKAVRHISTWR
jgi:hypothetical protein